MTAINGFGNEMDLKQRIIIDQDVLIGKSIIRNTRIAVEFILELLL